MIYKIITTQEQIYESFLKTGLIARGITKNIIDIQTYNLHDFAQDSHRTIDDTPYGGGAGMVLKVDIMAKALAKLKTKSSKVKTILMTPQGKKFTQADARRLAKEKELILISGRFEGYDERIRDLVDEEISIGDYILTSGDLPALVLIDSISRQIPDFIDRKESVQDESFTEEGVLEYPQYTRPVEFKGKKVPEILLSGNHQEIKSWRKAQSIKKSQKRLEK